MTDTPIVRVANQEAAVEWLRATGKRYELHTYFVPERGVIGVRAEVWAPGTAGTPAPDTVVLEWLHYGREFTPTVEDVTGEELEAWLRTVPFSRYGESLFHVLYATESRLYNDLVFGYLLLDFSNCTSLIRRCPAPDASPRVARLAMIGQEWPQVHDLHNLVARRWASSGVSWQDAQAKDTAP